jgi:hypothetical protein
MREISKKHWKFATIGIAVMLALIVTTPHANAAAVDVSKLVQQILNIVKSPEYGNQAIMNAITSLGGSAATGADVDTLQGTADDIEEKIDGLAENNGEFQIIRQFARSCGEDCFDFDFMVCTSDSDYLLYITGYGDTTSYIQIVPAFGPVAPFLNDLPDQHSITVGGYAGQPISIVPIDEPPNDPSDESPMVWVTLQTAVGATASCTVS